MEPKESKSKNGLSEKNGMSDAVINTMTALLKAGFNPDEGMNIMQGNLPQILYQLEAYKSHQVKKYICMLQVLER
jgi:hypothetical protein